MHYVALREEVINRGNTLSPINLYIGNSKNVLGNTGGGPSEIYLEGNGWIELHFVLEEDRDGYYAAIIESVPLDMDHFGRRETGKLNSDLTSIGRNPPVLIQIAHFVQPPERMSLEGCPSVIWLKRFDLTDSLVRDAFGLGDESFSRLRISLFENRKLRAFGNPRDCSQAPYELIERTPHTVKEVSSHKGDFLGNIRQPKPKDVQFILKIIFTRQTIGFRMDEVCDFNLQVVKVFLCPSHLQIGICIACHD